MPYCPPRCPFWDDSGETCALKDCSVETCEPDEVPLPWRAADPVDLDLENESSLGHGSDGSSSFSSASSTSASGCATPEWATSAAASSSEPTSLGQSLGHVTRAEQSDVKRWADDDNTELW